MNPHKQKIFCIGSSKTGTSSTGAALKDLGLNHLGGSWTTANQLMPMILSGDLDPLFSILDKHDSYDDVPFSHGSLYKTLYKRYPKAKFILTIRESNLWYESMIKQLNRYNARWNLSYNASLYQKCMSNNWSGLYEHLRLMYGEDAFMNNKNEMIAIFEKRNDDIRNFFEDKPDHLLELNIRRENNIKNGRMLAKFIGSNINITFPHKNHSKLWK